MAAELSDLRNELRQTLAAQTPIMSALVTRQEVLSTRMEVIFDRQEETEKRAEEALRRSEQETRQLFAMVRGNGLDRGSLIARVSELEQTVKELTNELQANRAERERELKGLVREIEADRAERLELRKVVESLSAKVISLASSVKHSQENSRARWKFWTGVAVQVVGVGGAIVVALIALIKKQQ